MNSATDLFSIHLVYFSAAGDHCVVYHIDLLQDNRLFFWVSLGRICLMEELKEIPMLRQLTPPDLCRTELAAAFGKLEKAMNAAAERIALNARLIAIITDTTEVEHAAETVSVATEGEAQAKLEVARDTRQNDASDEAENGVAAHVLKLHGLLGGFMKC